MKKYAINYNRTFPDHRVPIDYTFNKELMKGPSAYFRVHSNPFSSSKMASMQPQPKTFRLSSHYSLPSDSWQLHSGSTTAETATKCSSAGKTSQATSIDSLTQIPDHDQSRGLRHLRHHPAKILKGRRRSQRSSLDTVIILLIDPIYPYRLINCKIF